MIVAQRKHNYAGIENQKVKYPSTPVVTPKKNTKLKAIYKVQIIFLTLLIAGLCLGMLIGYAQLSELKYRINSLDKEILAIESNIENLKVEVGSVQRIDLIEEKAIMELGMVYPAKEQLVFMDMNKQDMMGVSTAVDKTEQHKEKNLAMDVKAAMSKLYSLLD